MGNKHVFFYQCLVPRLLAAGILEERSQAKGTRNSTESPLNYLITSGNGNRCSLQRATVCQQRPDGAGSQAEGPGQRELSTLGASLRSAEVRGLRTPFLTEPPATSHHPRLPGEAPLRHMCLRRGSCLGGWNRDPSLHSPHLLG